MCQHGDRRLTPKLATVSHALVVPLMLASVIGFATSNLVCPEGVYHALAHNFVMAEAVHRPKTAEART